MAAGRVLQIGPPAEVYARPRTPFAARFLGAANLLDGKLVGREAAVVMVRPEHCVLNPGPSASRFAWPGRIASVTFLGADRLAEVACDNGVSLRVRTRAGVAVDERVTVGIAEKGFWTIPDQDVENQP
jgi:ABC-type Fe3+/spermidine/putrescine transport system ATPase subunit